MDPRQDFRYYYSAARAELKRGNAAEARKCVLSILEVLNKLRLAAPNVITRIKTEALIGEFIAYARILRTEGITRELLSAFGLIKDAAPMSEVNPSVAPSAPSASANGAPSQGWVADIFERYKGGVVKVRAKGAESVFGGTGFVISRNGYLLTNEHVVYDEVTGKLCGDVFVLFGQDPEEYAARVIASDSRYDLALLETDELPAEAVVVPRIRDYSALKQGADVVVIGNAFSMGLAPIPGTIKFTHEGTSGNLVYTAPTNPGDSGGPVFNRLGECVGINKSVTSAFIRGGQRLESQGLTNATPMDYIEKRLSEWAKAYAVVI